MIEQNPSLLALLKHLQRVPYLASKNLYIVAQHFLDMDMEAAEQFCAVVMSVKHNVEKCTLCWAWKEKNKECIFCAAPRRDKELICVVENWRELIALEKTGAYIGVYHVLGGAICPLEGVGPEDLTIQHLLERIDNGCRELIFAFNQTPEGEVTASYIASKLKGKLVTITSLARGLPVGSSPESMDKLTLSKALVERRPF
jgi:recombination protein RecR